MLSIVMFCPVLVLQLPAKSLTVIFAFVTSPAPAVKVSWVLLLVAHVRPVITFSASLTPWTSITAFELGVEFKKPFPPITDVTPERIAAVPTLLIVGKLLSIVK